MPPARIHPRPRAVEVAGHKLGNHLRPRVDKAFVECERAWVKIDACGKVLGRLAAKIVPLLMGKHKPTYQPQRDSGDYVVVVNVAQSVLTGKTMDMKRYYRHSGLPGGLSFVTMAQLFAKNPVEPLRRAVNGMLPKNKLRLQRMKRLRLFPGLEHTHEGHFKPGQLAFTAITDDDPKIHTRLKPVAPPPSTS